MRRWKMASPKALSCLNPDGMGRYPRFSPRGKVDAIGRKLVSDALVLRYQTAESVNSDGLEGRQHASNHLALISAAYALARALSQKHRPPPRGLAA